MNIQRVVLTTHHIVLTTLAGLTILFLGAAAYQMWGDGLIPIHELKKRPASARYIPSFVDFTIHETGIVGVSAAQLRQVNLQFERLSRDELNLTRAGTPVPFYVNGEGSEATLYFYAQAITSTLEAPAVYRLSRDQGVSMQQRDAHPTGPGNPDVLLQYRWEENNTFLAQAEGDVWLGRLLLAPASWTVPLDHIEPGGGPGTLLVRIWSSNQDSPDPDHHLEITLNRHELLSWYWDGIRQATLTLPIDEGVLQAGDHNTLTISTPGDTGAVGEAVYVDWIHLYYQGQASTRRGQVWFGSNAANVRINGVDEQPLLFDVTDPNAPAVLLNFRYENGVVDFAGRSRDSHYVALEPDQAIQPTIGTTPTWTGSLRRRDRGADYVAIVADGDGFRMAIQPLLDYRQQQGLRVTAVPLDQVFSEFGHGRHTPEAIRNFLAYAATYWEPPAPRFVLLVGDATYDLHNHSNGRNQNLLPTYLARTESGYVTSDTWFTMYSGQIAPAIGRLPAQTAGQLENMVDKVIAYERNSGSAWTRRALFVAADHPRFNTLSYELAKLLDSNGYRVHKLTMRHNEDIHYDIMSALNKGVGLVNYAGHGGEQVWIDETVFQATDAGMLANSGRLPVFTTFTCLNGAFSHPDVDSLAESLLWVENGGIVAAIAPAARAAMDHQVQLATLFYQELLEGDSQTLGEALTWAKAAALDESDPNDAVHTVHLLGDPALQMHRP
ncbi:MAG TPA: C25 family cysteine peptidase [Anaerolineae bacterium]